MTHVSPGQTWRLRTIDGPAVIRVVRIEGNYTAAGRRVVHQCVSGPVHPDTVLRERDLTHSPNAELVDTGGGR